MEGNKTKVPAYLKVGKVVAYAMYAWVLFGIIVLVLRVFLLAFSANAATPFVNFIYNTSATFLQPFRGIFPPKSVGSTGYLDVAALFAIIIYGLLGWGFSALAHYMQSKIDGYKAAARANTTQRRETAAYEAPAPKQAPTKTRRPPTRTVQ